MFCYSATPATATVYIIYDGCITVPPLLLLQINCYSVHNLTFTTVQPLQLLLCIPLKTVLLQFSLSTSANELLKCISSNTGFLQYSLSNFYKNITMIDATHVQSYN